MTSKYIISAASAAQFIRDNKPKIVFAGRSNVGKSSVINRLTGNGKLAKVGNTPGKTSQVNYFLIDDAFYFVDLPGYGYAKVSHAERERWGRLMESFFDEPEHISLGVLVVDARHEPTALDIQMAQYFQQLCLPWTVLANKTDKLKPRQIEASVETIRETLVLDPSVACVPFSSQNGEGQKSALNSIFLALK